MTTEEFIAQHPDSSTWTPADFDSFEVIVQTERIPDPQPAPAVA